MISRTPTLAVVALVCGILVPQNVMVSNNYIIMSVSSSSSSSSSSNSSSSSIVVVTVVVNRYDGWREMNMEI